MGKERDFLKYLPQAKRDIETRAEKTPEDVEIARKFGYDFFDGNRRYGYGGYTDKGRYKKLAAALQWGYRLWPLMSSALDVGCAKGYLVKDLNARLVYTRGVDISEYAISQANIMCKVADARSLPFVDKMFTLAFSINTIHNLDEQDCAKALRELMRVSHKQYVTVDAYRDEFEKERMYKWNLTAKTIMSTKRWVEFFNDVGYTGDYGWFIP